MAIKHNTQVLSSFPSSKAIEDAALSSAGVEANHPTSFFSSSNPRWSIKATLHKISKTNHLRCSSVEQQPPPSYAVVIELEDQDLPSYEEAFKVMEKATSKDGWVEDPVGKVKEEHGLPSYKQALKVADENVASLEEKGEVDEEDQLASN